MNKSPRSEQQSPKRNHLLACLPATALRRLLPALELVALPLGRILLPPLDTMRYAHFPTTSIISLSYASDPNVSAKAWEIGNEGVVGLASLSRPIRNHQTEVQVAGQAYRIAAQALKTEFSRGGALQELLLGYLHACIMQVSQIGICNQHHPLDKRLDRFLLRAFDRAQSSELAITQQRAADLLGVRRVGVTEGVGRLQALGIVRCSRGHITLLNRRKLEARVCACYSAIKKEFDGLLRHKSASR
jgi:hypothetical protein